MKKYIALFFTIVLLYSFSTVEASSIEYPDNQSKSFQGASDFYDSLDKNVYEEYKNATFSYRQKIKFSDWSEAQNVFNMKTNLYSGRVSKGHFPHIDPNRQVYFFASFTQNAAEEWHKYVVIDAETQQVLLGGNTYQKYVNPYNK